MPTLFADGYHLTAGEVGAWVTLIVTFAGAVGGGLTYLVKLWYDARKGRIDLAKAQQDADIEARKKTTEIDRGNYDKLFEQYREWVAEARAQYKELEAAVMLVKDEHVKCLQNSARQEERIVWLEKELCKKDPQAGGK